MPTQTWTTNPSGTRKHPWEDVPPPTEEVYDPLPGPRGSVSSRTQGGRVMRQVPKGTYRPPTSPGTVLGRLVDGGGLPPSWDLP